MSSLAQVRGDTLIYSFTLSDTWTGASFTGGVRFVMRKTRVPSSTTTDADAFHISSVENGEISFIGNVGTITIAASVTTTWEPVKYYWDLQGVIAGTTPRVFTIDSGFLAVIADIGRGIT
jgi:hypothetical protein